MALKLGEVKNRIKRFIDFCLCLCFFPRGMRIIKYLYIPHGNSITDKFFLYIMSRNLSVDGDILEIGSYMGSSSILLASGNHSSHRRGKVWLVEHDPQPSKEALLGVFASHGFGDNVNLIAEKSEDARKIIDQTFRFIFVDGGHKYSEVKKDILLWADCLSDGGVISFHDIKFKSVAKAVSELIENSDKFRVLGILNNILYASKGNFRDGELVCRFNKLNAIRVKCINFVRIFTKQSKQQRERLRLNRTIDRKLRKLHIGTKRV